jgi:16S rRNA processing protein RimM
LPEPEDGHFYWSDLAGLKVVHRDGTELGNVKDMLETGAHDVMVVEGEQERLIPFVIDEIVLSVDLDERLISVDWEWD